MYQTLYKILCKERIEIPIIQRDYAQGRESKAYLRERLLGDMIQSLKDGRFFSLDFVYGTNEHGAIWPLDGQQRLTTLWLLHWYLAVRTDNLSTANSWLERFTYETRATSRDFCKSLCCLDAKAFNHSGIKIVDYITNQTWFYSRYKQDSTITGMLRTLGGTNITNSKNEDICDGIEEFLASDDNCQTYWERLIADDCPIRFLFKDMKDENLPLSDDLYIKMNARGKQLTDFENFKADLIGFAPDQDYPDNKLLDVKTASLIDNEWTDVFWKCASEKGVFKVDEIYFIFLQRFFLNRLIATSPRTVQEIQKVSLYQDLYNGKDKYEGLNGYREVLTSATINSLKTILARWNGVKIAPYWDDTSVFFFIPEYIIKNKNATDAPLDVEVETISQKERAIFHAVCCFFEYNESFNSEQFEQWMHFAWNIVENSNINNEDAMIGAIRLFEELKTHSGDILRFLSSNKEIRSNFAAKQMEEERFKAKLLCGEHNKIWRTLLIEAEEMLFFKGNISCLLRNNAKGYVDDVESFRLKLSNAKKYFDDKGIRDEYALPLTKALIRIAHSWGQIVEQYIYDTSSEAWKQNILHNADNKYYLEVHTLLTTNNLESLDFVNINDSDREWVYSANNIKKILANTKFLDYMPMTRYGNIVCNGSEWRLHFAGFLPTFYPYRRNYAYCFDWIDPDSNYSFRRNSLLHHYNIMVDKDKNPDVEGIYWQWQVYFNYKGDSFRWDYDNIIYLLNRQNNPKRRDSSHSNNRIDEYFCIDMNKLPTLTQQSLLVRLSRLASEAKS